MSSPDPRLLAAVEHHRAGRLPEAEAGYRKLLKKRPRDADALQLLGSLLHRLGRDDEALVHLQAAVASDPIHPAAHANLGLVFRGLGRLDDAARSLSTAVEQRPDFPEAWNNLARVHAARGALDDADSAVARAIQLSPGSSEPWRIRVGIAAARQDPAAVEDAIAGVLAIEPDPSMALGLAQLRLVRGEVERALEPLKTAVRSGNPAAWLAFGECVAQLDTPSADLGPWIEQALARPELDAQRLERAARAVLDAAPSDTEREKLPLYRSLLLRTIVMHPDWEVHLADLRRRQLARPGAADLALAEALAVQAFVTEHAAIREVPAEVAELDWDDPTEAAVRASYEPLDPRWLAPGWESGPLVHLVRAALAEPAEEAELLPTVEALGGDLANHTSAVVGAMYEENPYPRLVRVQRPPRRPLSAILAGVSGRPGEVPEGPLDVLVAGCGTGQHPLQTATHWDQVSVLGVDLSRRSLARATRVARAERVDNVRFLQADLLRLGELGRSFHVVESVGVLHHLADPAAGFSVLRGLVRPGGLMRVGLYAERGRSDIVAGRELCADLTPDPAGLRRARARILALPEDHPARPVVWSPDFWSLSGVRDLLFHPCEHRFTLPGLAALLESLDLSFIGFQHALLRVPALYQARWPDDPAMADLSRWEELEAEFPRLFSGMYVFWCRPR